MTSFAFKFFPAPFLYFGQHGWTSLNLSKYSFLKVGLYQREKERGGANNNGIYYFYMLPLILKCYLELWESYTHNAVFKMDNQQKPTVQHMELLSVMCHNTVVCVNTPGWERCLGKNGYMYMHGRVPSLYTWNYHNIVNWLYPIKNVFSAKKIKLKRKINKKKCYLDKT